MEEQQIMIETSIALAELIAKSTVSAVNKKVRAAKTINNIEQLRNTYDEIINELLSEREQALHIAQTYKSEIDRIVISDKDIEHLHRTVEKVLEILNIPTGGNDGDTEGSIEQIKDLISVDVLKTMQLLGFNYKEAIGEPLTEICASKIRDFGGIKETKSKEKGKKK